jgi:hypothetical protein
LSWPVNVIVAHQKDSGRLVGGIVHLAAVVVRHVDTLEGFGGSVIYREYRGEFSQRVVHGIGGRRLWSWSAAA